MKLPRLRVAAIWLVSAWPAFNYLATNWAEFVRRGAHEFVGIALITVAFALVGHVALRIGSKRGVGGQVVAGCLAAIVLLFGYSKVSWVSDQMFDWYQLRIPALLAWSVIVLLVGAAIVRYGKNEKFQHATLAFSLFTGLISSVGLIVAMASYESTDSAAASADTAFVPKPPRLPGLHVYYILLDAYGGQRGLKQAAGFDNSEFYARMRARGFTDMSNERSNYLRTVNTLGAIFALNYFKTDDPRTWKSNYGIYPELFDAPTIPPLVRRLNAAGYTAWHSATAWGGCSHRYLNCLGNEVALDADYVTQSFLATTPFGRQLMYLAGENDNAFRSITSRLPLLLASGNGTFIFAHHMSPHPPYLMDKDCHRHQYYHTTWNMWPKGEEPDYIGAVECVNSQVERLVDIIVRLNPNALIVLQSDHGSAFSLDWEQPMATWPANGVRERASFLNLVRAPLDCRRWLDRPMGQVNTARFVVGCIEGSQPDYLPERTYMSTYSNGFEKSVVRLAPESLLFGPETARVAAQ